MKLLRSVASIVALLATLPNDAEAYELVGEGRCLARQRTAYSRMAMGGAASPDDCNRMCEEAMCVQTLRKDHRYRGFSHAPLALRGGNKRNCLCFYDCNKLPKLRRKLGWSRYDPAGCDGKYGRGPVKATDGENPFVCYRN